MIDDFYTVTSYGYEFDVDAWGEDIMIDVSTVDDILLTEEDLELMLSVVRSRANK